MKLNLIVASVPFIFASSIAFAQSLDIGSNENSIKLPETTPSIPVEDPKHNLGVIGEATKDVYQEAFQREIESGKSTPEEAAIIARQEAEAFLYELDQTIDLPNGELPGPHDPLKPQPLPEKPAPVKPEPSPEKPDFGATNPVEDPTRVDGIIAEGAAEAYRSAAYDELTNGKGEAGDGAARIAGRQAAEAYLREVDEAVDLPVGEVPGPSDPIKPQPQPEKPTPVKPEPAPEKPDHGATNPVEDPTRVDGIIAEGTAEAYRSAAYDELTNGKGEVGDGSARIAGRQAAEAYLREVDEAIDLPVGEVPGPHDPITKPEPIKPLPEIPAKPPTNPVEPVKPLPEIPAKPPTNPVEPVKPLPEIGDGDLTENAGEGQVMTKMVKLEALENASGSEDPIRDIVDNIKPTPNESGELEPTTPGTFSGEGVESLSAALQAQSEEYMDYHDNAMATTQATVNARPQVTNGQFALGAGVGFSGDSEAVSVGAAKSFGESGWSASATVTGTSETTYVETEVSAGAGVQYAF
ncbi:YadA-like family protein [Vibrio kyushuensis]|uniref:YadA C-terminal domain-containing protein n=1 Tax=Vibrio kyushuensis TaxID=2910249 RepID=UPI003D0DA7AA